MKFIYSLNLSAPKSTIGLYEVTTYMDKVQASIATNLSKLARDTNLNTWSFDCLYIWIFGHLGVKSICIANSQ